MDTFCNYLDPQISALVNRADIIIVQRNIMRQQAWDAIDYWRGMGKAVVCDLDDDYPHLPISNPAHRFWIANGLNLNPAPIDALRIGLSKCDGLTSPSKIILDDWANVVPSYWLPNYAHGAWWKNLPDREEEKAKAGLEGKIIIGWGGSVSHYDSWWGSGIREAASELVECFPQVVFKICGNDPRIHAQLPVPDANKVLQPGVPPDEWPKIVATFDIGIAPLYGSYDQRRSWIKPLEYMLAGVPWVATDGVPYFQMADYGILIQNGADNWLNALGPMIENLADCQRQMKEMRPMAFERWAMENNVQSTIALYEKIIARRRSVPILPGILWINQKETNGDATRSAQPVAG